MNLFDALVEEALGGDEGLAIIRPVVEKEILHHDILREMAKAGFLGRLGFIGGTCLRDCHGSERLSEDLDFTGGRDFKRSDLEELREVLEGAIRAKYGLPVEVSPPVKESGDVDTWKIKMTTRPERPDLPTQKINIDIVAIESHDLRPAMLRNRYGIDLGTSGLILKAESKEEILADKVIALGLRPNRVKNRDIWDLLWLARRGLRVSRDLVAEKLRDRGVEGTAFAAALRPRVESLASGFRDFRFEMRRFLPRTEFRVVEEEGYWDYAVATVKELVEG